MKVAGIRSTECREFLDKLQLPIAPLEKLGTEISLGARRRSLDKANPDEEQGVRFLDDLELACATRAQLLVSDEKRHLQPKIGRAACRGRGCRYGELSGVDGSWTQKARENDKISGLWDREY